jgi:hypothetical protein
MAGYLFRTPWRLPHAYHVPLEVIGEKLPVTQIEVNGLTKLQVNLMQLRRLGDELAYHMQLIYCQVPQCLAYRGQIDFCPNNLDG